MFDSGVARILVRRSHSDDTIEEGPGDAPTEMYKKQLYRNRIQSNEKKVEILKSLGEWNTSLQEPVQRQ